MSARLTGMAGTVIDADVVDHAIPVLHLDRGELPGRPG